MELSGINEFLEQYRQRLFSVQNERQILIETIARVSGIQLTEKEITLNRGILELHVDSITKNEIFLHKTGILEAVKKTATIKKTIVDIR